MPWYRSTDQKPEQSGSKWTQPKQRGEQEAAKRPEDVTPEVEKIPFMAESLDANGQAYYGEGAKGLARKIYAKVFDPDKLMSLNTSEKAQNMFDDEKEMEERKLAGNQGWLAKWAGISVEEQATVEAAKAIGKADVKEGEEAVDAEAETSIGKALAQNVGIAYRATGQALWVGLDALGVGDKIVRKYVAFADAADEIGDTSVLPDITSEAVMEKFKDTPYEEVANALMNFSNLLPSTITYNALRMATSGRTIEEGKSIIEERLRSSQMVYTMMVDEQKKAEYFRRVQAGENPDLLMRELENVWVELAGSILGDPGTYLGASIPGKLGKGAKQAKFAGLIKLPWDEAGKLPTMSQILGLKIGTQKIKSSADLFQLAASTKVDDAFQKLADIADDQGAIDAILGTAKEVAEEAKKYSGKYFFGADSHAKADLTKKIVGTTLKALTSGGDTDDVLELMKNYRLLKSDKPEAVGKALLAMKEQYGMIPFSKAGMQTLAFLDDLQEGVDVVALAKTFDDPAEFAGDIINKVYNRIDRFFPSVDDMEKASEIVAKSKKLGQVPDARHAELADRLRDVPWIVKRSNKVHNALYASKAGRGLNSFFANTLMGMSPGYAMRNLQSDAALTAIDLGADIAGEVLVTGLASLPTEKGAQSLLLKNVRKQEAMLGGASAYTTTKGVGKVGFIPQKAAPGLTLGRRAEQSSSAVITTRVVEAEMSAALRSGVMPNVQKHIPGLSSAHEGTLASLMLENWGDAKKTRSAFIETAKKGEFDKWRYADLDPTFEKAVKNVGLYDEIDALRKAAGTPEEFVDGMGELYKRMADKAAEVANDPALVSADNPLSQAVAELEAAFKTQVDGEEWNAFRAKVEVRSQLRGAFDAVIREVQARVIKLNNDPALVQTYNNKLTQIADKAEFQNGRLRDFAQKVTDIYKDSKFRKVSPAELWERATLALSQNSDEMARISDMFPDVDPKTLTNAEFDGMLWKWQKQTGEKLWSEWTQQHLVRTEAALEEFAVNAGINMDDIMQEVSASSQPMLDKLAALSDLANQWDDYGKGFDKAKEAVEAGAEAVEEVGKFSTKLAPPPPYVEGTRPTQARQLYENLTGGMKAAWDDFTRQTVEQWGTKEAITDLTPEQLDGLDAWSKELGKRTAQARVRAMAVADETRNFVMHDYNKSYTDHVASYFTMYHYWPSRTYAKSLERAIDKPGVIGAYAKYRQALEKINADQPEYMRYSQTVKSLPGFNDGPYIFNLERTLNPINGLTGVDFEDPRKRVDWMTAAVDDANKMGFNMAIPLQWAMAARMYAKGEEDAGRRWAGRLVPATKSLKAAINLIQNKIPGLEIPDIAPLPGAKYGEFDPFVNALSEGVDQYEEGQVGRAMAAMVQNGVSPEDAYDAMYTRSGPLYDKAVRDAIVQRAPSQLTSFLLGVGYKGRGQADLEVDAFYNEWYQLLSMRDDISPNDFKDQMLRIKEDYPFSDAVLLSKKGGDERDAAYSYNVLSRLPPGDMYTIMEEAGVPSDLTRRFYEDKGNFQNWEKQDRDRFMAAILDLSVAFSLPDTATQQAWNDAKGTYNDVYKEIERLYGADIWDKVSTFYDLLDEDKDAAYQFKDEYPEVQLALTAKSEAVNTDPKLFEYYGSFEKLETYWDGWVRNELQKKFGNTSAQWAEYYAIKVEVEAGNMPKSELDKFRKANSHLFGPYQTLKKELEKIAEKKFVEAAESLPEQPEAQLREGFEPQNATQEAIVEAAQGQGNMPTWDQVEGVLRNKTVANAVRSSIESGKAIPKQAASQVEYAARTNGMSMDEFIQLATIALRRQP